MFFSELDTYIRHILSFVPWGHWAFMFIISLAVFGILWARTQRMYGAFSIGIAVFVSLIILDLAVIIRYLGIVPLWTGINLKLDVIRFLRATDYNRAESFSNFAAFIPLGFFLAEFLASTKKFGAWRQLVLASLAALGLSMSIEVLQLVLRVGYFELADLVINTFGAFVGVILAFLIRKFFLYSLPHSRNDKREIIS